MTPALESNGYLCVIQWSGNLPDGTAQNILCPPRASLGFLMVLFHVGCEILVAVALLTVWEQLEPGLGLPLR